MRARRYVKIEGDGPVTAHWRRSTGAFEAWTFPDGTVEHYRRREGDVVVEERHFDAFGRPLTAVTFSDGEPAQVQVFGVWPGAFDVSGWAPQQIGGWALPLPPEIGPSQGDQLVWARPDGTIAARALPSAGDPASDAFGDRLAVDCGCTLLDRTSAWVDGRAGVRYRVRVPGIVPLEGDLWAIPDQGSVLLVAAIGPLGSEVTALGRGVVALAKKAAP